MVTGNAWRTSSPGQSKTQTAMGTGNAQRTSNYGQNKTQTRKEVYIQCTKESQTQLSPH